MSVKRKWVAAISPGFDQLKQRVMGSRQGIRDVLVSMVPQLVRAVTGFLTSVLLARGLGPGGLGQFALVLSLAESTAQLSDLGIGQTAIRFASRAAAAGDRAGQLAVLRWAFRLRILMVMAVSVILFMLAPVLANRVWEIESLTPLIRLGLLAGIFSALAAVPMIYFQSLKRFGMNSIVLTGQVLMNFLGILLVAWWGAWSVAAVVMVSVASLGIGAVLFLLMVPGEVLWQPRGALDRQRAWQSFWRSPTLVSATDDEGGGHSPDRFAFFMLLSTIIILVTIRLDVWMMGAYVEESELGFYSAAMRFTLPLTIALGGLQTALWPRASALTRFADSRSLLLKTFRLSALLAAGSLLYAWLVPLLAPLLFGEEYRSSVLLGQLLCLRYVFVILITPVGIVGYSFGMVRVYWLINLFQLVVVASLNVLLLPRIGPVGSAIALIVNDVVGFVVVGLILRHKLSVGEAGQAGS